MIAHLAYALGLSALIACEASQARLAHGGPAAATAAGSDTGMQHMRRVWARAEDYATPSPDGRYVTYVDWSTGDVAMHDITSGESRRLTDKGTWTQNGSWAEEPLFSPDGRRVAYSYGNLLGPGRGFQYELRVVTLGDTTPRVLLALTPRDQWIAPMDWSAAQGILVEINRGEDKGFVTELAVVNPATGAVRLLRTYAQGQSHPHDGAFSPDGRFIAYRQGKEARVMTGDGARDASLGMEVRWVLGWADGRTVLVHASHRSTTGVWAVPVTSEGQRAGDPTLVRGGLSAFLPGGFTRGAYYYVVPVDAPKVYTATIDVASGRVLSPPTAITSPVDGAARNPAWSPDGRTLAYIVRDVSERVTRVMLRAADGDDLRELASIPQEQVLLTLWSPDGQAVYLGAGTDQGPTLFRVDIRTGAVSVAFRSAAQGAAFAPNGELVYSRHAPNRPELPSGLFARDLATGRERRISESVGETRTLAVSPDGRSVAWVGRQGVSIMPFAGGTKRDLLTTELPAHLEGGASALPWTRDGRYLLVVRGEWERPGSHELLAVPVDGGAPVRLVGLGDVPGGRPHLSLHPDGRRLAYAGGEMRQEMWALALTATP